MEVGSRLALFGGIEMAKSKQGKRPLNKLTAAFVSTYNEAGRHGDGGGLYLVIRPGGSRSWTFLYKKGSKLREMGLGAFDAKGEIGLTLAGARNKAAEARILLHSGQDPIAVRRAATIARQQPENETFGVFADRYLESIKGGFKNPKTVSDWKRNIEIHAESLRPISLDAITTDDVLAVIRPLWTAKYKTARELRGKIEQVLDAAKAGQAGRGEPRSVERSPRRLL